MRVRWDDVEELRDAFDNHAYRNSLCAVKGKSLATQFSSLTTDCPHPHLIRPESHYKNSHDPSDFRDELLRPSLVLEPGKLPELPPLPKSLPAYLVTTHEIRPFQDRPLPAIPTPGPRLRELREPILEIRDVDDVPAMRPAALWDSSDFATMELEDDEEGTVIGEVNGAPVIRLSAPPPTPLQGGRKRKRGERASSVLSDASWAPSVAPSSPGSVRMGPPPLRASGSQPIIREETPFSIRDETPTPSTPKRALRQTPSAEQPIVIQPPARKRSKPIFAKNRILLSTVTLPDGPVLVASAGARGAQPMRLIKRTGKPREIPQPLDYILDRAEKAHKAKEAAAAVKTEVKLEPGSASPAPPSSMPSQATATQTQVGSSQASLPGPSQLSQSSQPLSASQAMLPPTQPRRGRRAAKAAVRDDDHVISRAAEDWAFAKTGRYCGISFWEHKMAFETAVAQRRLEKNMADLVGPPLPSNPQPSQVRTTASKPSL